MRYLTLIALVLSATTAQADFWDNCTAYGGTIITANSYGNDKGGLCNDPSNPDLTNNCNGKRFCRGGNLMNWWSSFTWCESIGGQLASFENACPGTQPLSRITCANIKGVHNGCGRTNMSKNTGEAFDVDLSSGNIDTHNRNYVDGWVCRPLCEEQSLNFFLKNT